MDGVAFDAPAVERGVGFFETVLLFGRRAALWEPHLQRLLGTLARFRLPAPTRDEVAASAARAVEAAAADEEQALRLTWLAIGRNLDARSSWRLDVSTRPIPPTTLARREGSHAVTLPRTLTRDTPTVKSTSYLSAALGLREAQRRGGDEGLFVNSGGSYLEGTSAALIGWNRGRLLVSSGGVLPSVTAAAFLGSWPAERRAIRRADLRAGGCLLGSLTGAAPLQSLDGRACDQPIDMLQRLAEFNGDIVRTATPL